MSETLTIIVFGHFVGDFFLQHRLMAENKFLQGWRACGWCALHVVAYTMTVAIFAQNFSLLFLAGVSIPHFIADRYSFAYHWMRLLGRDDLLGHNNPTKASLGTIIYVIIDQTYHLGCLYVLVLVTQH